MQSKQKFIKVLILACSIFCLAAPQASAQIIQRPQIKVDPKSGLVTDAPYTAQDYAPYVWYDHYDYQGTGNEFASYQVQRIFDQDGQGRAQFRVFSGSLIDYVLESSLRGVVELAYFMNESEQKTDYRYHEDAQDAYIKTIIPSSLEPGTEFYQSYGQEDPMVVVGILQQFEVLGQMYYDVLLIESQEGSEPIQRFYYAPKIGLIQRDFEDQGTLIQSQLKGFQ